MDLKSLLIAIVFVIPGILIGVIFGYWSYIVDIKNLDDYDVFEDYYGRKE